MERRTLLKWGVAAPAVAGPAAWLAAASPAAAELRPRKGKTLASNLAVPWGLDFLPDGDALVGERNTGRVLRVASSGSGATPVGTISGAFNNGGEGGLLGIALSPHFATDQWVYMYLTTQNDNRVIRVKYDGSTLSGRQDLLTGIPSGNTHNGGCLWFTKGSPTSLFVSVGDTRNSALAQNKSSLAGKILRLKMDGTAQSGNPFGTRVYTYGHRNVEGVTIGPRGRIWASELGENTWDELNVIRAGRNYGWPKQEGPDGPGGYPDPFTQWHPENCSPSGVAIAHGRAWVGALRGQSLWSVDIGGHNEKERVRHFRNAFGRIRNVKLAPDNTLWITTSNRDGRGTPTATDDRVIRIRFV
jgi:glucose/arabinose dehydrogenase